MAACIAALLCPAVLLFSALLSYADWLRRHPTAPNVARAVRLDPSNAYGHTLAAELHERAGATEAAEQSWREALRRDRHHGEAWVRSALLAESRDAGAEAEQLLLQGARLHQTWLTRWALASFYARHQNSDELKIWATRALARSSDDAGSLFALLDDNGIETVPILPPNRRVLRAYLEYRLARGSLASVPAAAATRLARLIPASTRGWPGTGETPFLRLAYPADPHERWVLMRCVERLLESGAGASAVEVWNAMQPEAQWRPERPLVSTRPRNTADGSGFLWKAEAASGIEIDTTSDPEALVLRLNGRHVDAPALLAQRVYTPRDGSYVLTAESRTEGLKSATGLEWVIVARDGMELARLAVPVSEAWTRASVVQARNSFNEIRGVSDRSLTVAALPDRLTLATRRAPGTAREAGTVYLRSITLEKRP